MFRSIDVWKTISFLAPHLCICPQLQMQGATVVKELRRKCMVCKSTHTSEENEVWVLA